MKASRKWISFSLKVAVSLAAFAYVGYKLTQSHGVLDGSITPYELFLNIPADTGLLLIPAALLLALNLGVEARKWQLLMREFYPEIALSTAIKAVLSGMTTGIFTPNRLGEYAGRVLYLEEGHRLEATLLTFLDRISQMFITLVSGIVALLIMLGEYGEVIEDFFGSKASAQLISLVLGGMLFFIVGFVFNPRFLLLILRRLEIRKPWAEKVAATLEHVKTGLLRKILLLSMFRYLVFSTQYVLLLYGFGFGGNVLLAYGMVAMIFLLKSLVPFVGLSELGVRESAAISIMGLFSIAPWIALKSTLALYVINIIAPSLVGVVFLYGWKLGFRKNKPT
ncbi:MAG: flippase-like domain-containing protein [Bacteroidia bacterium]|nr:flippase-like domain-containing protein [Bacteroidia bacterium]